MTSILENAAVIAPRQVLTARQRALLTSVEKLEGKRIKNGWDFAGQRYSYSLVEAVKARRLIREMNTGFAKRLRLTEAGQLALMQLERTRKEKSQ